MGEKKKRTTDFQPMDHFAIENSDKEIAQKKAKGKREKGKNVQKKTLVKNVVETNKEEQKMWPTSEQKTRANRGETAEQAVKGGGGGEERTM